ncbi:ribonuclease H1 domain-containing protein [Veillonella sp.]
MAKKFYAVKAGRTPGIYESWSDCEKQVKGFGGAIYKSFPTKAEAQAFIGDEGMSIGDYLSSSNVSRKKIPTEKSKTPDFSEPNHLIAYIDGSYDKYNQSVGSGGIMFLNGDKETFSFGTKEAQYTDFWNVSGELLAAMYVMSYALEQGIPKCSLYYDYMGIEMWATKKWKRNNVLTNEYATFCEDVFPHVKVYFHKVSAHTGDTYNELADQLAKAGAAKGQ